MDKKGRVLSGKFWGEGCAVSADFPGGDIDGSGLVMNRG
jgi:hypothetical protein